MEASEGHLQSICICNVNSCSLGLELILLFSLTLNKTLGQVIDRDLSGLNKGYKAQKTAAETPVEDAGVDLINCESIIQVEMSRPPKCSKQLLPMA